MKYQVGQSITAKDIPNLPDGAAFKATFSDGIGNSANHIFRMPLDKEDNYTLPMRGIDVPVRAIRFDNHWGPCGWHSARIVSLPEGYGEPSPGDGYRWVEKSEILAEGDEFQRVGGSWAKTKDAGMPHCSILTYRRRIEPQAVMRPTLDEPVFCGYCKRPKLENVHALCGQHSGIDYADEPPREYTQIERAAAMALVWDRMENLKKQLSYGMQDCEVVASASRVYLEAEAHARKVGAL